MNTKFYAPGNIENTLKQGDTPIIQASFRYPILEDQYATLNSCLYQNAASLLHLYKLFLEKEASAQASVTSKHLPFRIFGRFTSTNENTVFSYFQDVEVFAGALRPITHRFAHNYTLNDQKTIFLASLFPKHIDLAAHIANKITQSAKYEWVFGKYTALKEHFSPERFYITAEGLAVFYPLHSLAVPAMGIPVFIIPFCDKSGPFPITQKA